MKSIIYFTVALLFTINSLAQIPESRHHTLETVNSVTILDGNGPVITSNSGINNLEKLCPHLKSTAESEPAWDSIFREKRDSANTQWLTYQKELFAYNEQGSMTKDIAYNWDENEQGWYSASKYEYTYDINGNQKSKTLSFSENGIGNWLPHSKYEYYYTDKGLEDYQLYSEWNAETGEWELHRKSDNIYNANDQPIINLQYFEDEDSGEWINIAKNEYFYHDEWNKTGIFYSRESEGDQWEAEIKTDVIYNSDFNVKVVDNYFWDVSINDWDPMFRIEYDYNENGDQTLFKHLSWNDTANAWYNDSKIVYTYDSTRRTFEHSYDWDISNEEWILVRRGSYHYLSPPHGFEEVANNTLRLYPNPANDYVSIDAEDWRQATVELYNIEGKLVLQQDIQPHNKIPIHHLKRGVYLYKIIGNDTIGSGKMMIER
ncbi:MAG: T9SS type A sorting domain-containing protein [Bacteroidales bacterium]|nr:T9SS type A sorting domain-containing protein [Bacteroidales bacterium]